MKKVLCAVVTVATVMSMSFVTFAASNIRAVEGYGWISGNISPSTAGGYKVCTGTSVSVNPDNAYLKTKIELQDMYGYTQANYENTSERGERSFSYDFPVPHFDDVNAVYGSHNVQGGRTHAAQVIYTVTTSIPN